MEMPFYDIFRKKWPTLSDNFLDDIVCTLNFFNGEEEITVICYFFYVVVVVSHFIVSLQLFIC